MTEHYVLEIVYVTKQYLDGCITAEEMANQIVVILTTYDLFKVQE